MRWRFYMNRVVWRLTRAVCWLTGHDAPRGECYRCGLIVHPEHTIFGGDSDYL